MGTQTEYFSLQGRLSFGDRLPNGKPGRVRWAQNAAALSIALAITEESIKESHSGHRAKDQIIVLEKGVTTEYTLHGFNVDNLADALYAGRHAITAGSVSAEPLPAELEAGDYFALDHQNTSAWALVDSASPAVPLVEDTHYAITSPFAGHGQLLQAVTGLQKPILASYSYAASNALALFSTTPNETFLMFDGIDTIRKRRIYLELARHQSKPVSGLQLINNEGAGTMAFTGEALYDGRDPDFPYGKLVMAAA